MNSNIFLRILCSLPTIFVFLYFLPFVGICLIILRSFVYKNKNRNSTPIILIGVGIMLIIPKIINYLFNILNLETEIIPFVSDILRSELYTKDFVNYGKYLIIAGIILLIISYGLKSIIEKISTKVNSSMQSYINESVKQDAEISKQNDMEIKIKQEKAKNTSYVKCPNCGSDNLLSEKFGTCKYCRRKIENKNFKV